MIIKSPTMDELWFLIWVVTADVNGFYRLDPYGRALRENKIIDGQVFSLDNRYDVMGRQTEISYPKGEWVSYEYNYLGELMESISVSEQAPIYEQSFRRLSWSIVSRLWFRD